METFTVGCINSDFCDAFTTFYSEAEYDIYGDDWMCADCYDAEEMDFYGWSDSDALASAGHGMDEDY